MPRKTKRTKECERDISKTLAYSSVFNYPLSKFQLYNYLISNQIYKPKYFETNLQRLVKNKVVKENKDKYYLYRTKTINWNKRYKISKKKIERNTKVFNFLSKIPWINLLAVTGSVSNYNATTKKDIDIFIITKRNRVWLTRFFVFLILKIFKKYRKGSKDDFCANLYMDQSKILWPKTNRNIYVAHSIITMQPIINKNNCYRNFVNENFWIFDYFKHFSLCLNNQYKSENNKENKNHLFDLIESIFWIGQKLYMAPKMTTEIIGRKIIHFNKNDHSKKILQNYKNILNNRKIS